MLIWTVGLYLLEGEVLNRALLAIEVNIAGIAAAQPPYSLELTLQTFLRNLLDSLHTKAKSTFVIKLL